MVTAFASAKWPIGDSIVATSLHAGEGIRFPSYAKIASAAAFVSAAALVIPTRGIQFHYQS